MYTANTVARAIEALTSLPNSSAQEAVSSDKKNDCERAGAAVMRMIETDLRPSILLVKIIRERDHGRYRAWQLNECGTSSRTAQCAGELTLDDFTRLRASPGISRR